MDHRADPLHYYIISYQVLKTELSTIQSESPWMALTSCTTNKTLLKKKKRIPENLLESSDVLKMGSFYIVQFRQMKRSHFSMEILKQPQKDSQRASQQLGKDGEEKREGVNTCRNHQEEMDSLVSLGPFPCPRRINCSKYPSLFDPMICHSSRKKWIPRAHFCIYFKLFIVKAMHTGFSVSEN